LNEVICIFISSLEKIVKKRQLKVSVANDSTIENALEIVRDELNDEFEYEVYSSSGILNKYIIILLNGVDVRKLNGLTTKIIKGDKITLVPAIAGG